MAPLSQHRTHPDKSSALKEIYYLEGRASGGGRAAKADSKQQ